MYASLDLDDETAAGPRPGYGTHPLNYLEPYPAPTPGGTTVASPRSVHPWIRAGGGHDQLSCKQRDRRGYEGRARS